MKASATLHFALMKCLTLVAVTVTFAVKTDELSESTFEEPRARLSGLEDTHGVISLESQRNQELIHQLSAYFIAKEPLTLKGEFKDKLTGTVGAWMLEVQLSKRNSPGSRQEGTTTYEFDAALASKHLRGAWLSDASTVQQMY